MARDGRFSRFLAAAAALGLVFHRAMKRPATDPPPAVGREIPPTDPTPATHDDPSNGSHPMPPRKSPRGLSGIYHLITQAFGRFMDDDCMTMAAALAYYTTFSIAPLLLIVISIVGLVFGRQAVQHEIQAQIQGLIGQGAASQVGAMVQNAGRHSSSGVVGAVLGLLALLFGATGALTQLQSSLDRIWHVKPDPRAGGVKNFIGQRILSFGMILGIAFLLVVSLAVSAALSAFGGFVSSVLPHGFSGPLLQAIGFIVSLAIIAALFAAMFKSLPDARIRWGDVWIGSAITSVLFTIGKFLIGIYLGHSGTASSYGAAGSLVLVVLWIYYSSLIFLFGAEFTALWSMAHSGAVQPKQGAVLVKTEEIIQPGKAA